MTLNPLPLYPAAGGYVLRLHRDARPEAGDLCGLIEHVTSGERADFTNGDELFRWLVKHAAQLRARPASPQGNQ